MATTYCGGERLIAGLQTQMNDKKGETFMSKKTRCRVLSLLLALVMVLGMVPMASASSAYNVKLTPDDSGCEQAEHRHSAEQIQAAEW